MRQPVMKPTTLILFGMGVVVLLLFWFSQRNELVTFVRNSPEAQSALDTMNAPHIEGYLTPEGKNYTFMIVSEDVQGKKDWHVFYKMDQPNALARYVGKLSPLFSVDWFILLPIKVGDDELFIGYTTVNKPLYALVERPNTDRKKWMCDQFEATVEKGLFLMPFTYAPEKTSANDCWLGKRWDSVSRIAIQTKETLQRGFEGKGSYYEKEETLAPALPITYIVVR